MSSKYIFSVLGMEDKACEDLEDQLNRDKDDVNIWIFNKEGYVWKISDSNHLNVVTVKGMEDSKVKLLNEKLNNGKQKYVVVNKPVSLWRVEFDKDDWIRMWNMAMVCWTYIRFYL